MSTHSASVMPLTFHDAAASPDTELFYDVLPVPHKKKWHLHEKIPFSYKYHPWCPIFT
jgi:hypothetical protein